MKCIIAGSRGFNDYEFLKETIALSKFQITEVVSGGAKGVDELGERWANENGIPLRIFPANWQDLSGPKVLKRINYYGKEYNALAGTIRNEEMAKYGEALIAIHKNKSKGTADMINLAERYNLKVFVKEI